MAFLYGEQSDPSCDTTVLQSNFQKVQLYWLWAKKLRVSLLSFSSKGQSEIPLSKTNGSLDWVHFSVLFSQSFDLQLVTDVCNREAIPG
ncbi:MAG: hypothetical protein RL235_554 [Chlamydiota bacterium]